MIDHENPAASRTQERNEIAIGSAFGPIRAGSRRSASSERNLARQLDVSLTPPGSAGDR